MPPRTWELVHLKLRTVPVGGTKHPSTSKVWIPQLMGPTRGSASPLLSHMGPWQHFSFESCHSIILVDHCSYTTCCNFGNLGTRLRLLGIRAGQVAPGQQFAVLPRASQANMSMDKDMSRLFLSVVVVAGLGSSESVFQPLGTILGLE